LALDAKVLTELMDGEVYLGADVARHPAGIELLQPFLKKRKRFVLIRSNLLYCR
jgi:hypothetical protein